MRIGLSRVPASPPSLLQEVPADTISVFPAHEVERTLDLRSLVEFARERR